MLYSMIQKNFIALVLTVFSLMNLTVTHLGKFIHLTSREEITRSSSFCPNSDSGKAGGDASVVVSTTTNQPILLAVKELKWVDGENFGAFELSYVGKTLEI